MAYSQKLADTEKQLAEAGEKIREHEYTIETYDEAQRKWAGRIQALQDDYDAAIGRHAFEVADLKDQVKRLAATIEALQDEGEWLKNSQRETYECVECGEIFLKPLEKDICVCCRTKLGYGNNPAWSQPNA